MNERTNASTWLTKPYNQYSYASSTQRKAMIKKALIQKFTFVSQHCNYEPTTSHKIYTQPCAATLTTSGSLQSQRSDVQSATW